MAETGTATELKQKGNQAFKEHDWLNAVHFYTKAIEANDKDPSFFCNRAQVNSALCFCFCESSAYSAQANIKLESYGYAIADASKAIELDNSYVKVFLISFDPMQT